MTDMRERLAQAVYELVRHGWRIDPIPERPSESFLIGRVEEEEARVRAMREAS